MPDPTDQELHEAELDLMGPFARAGEELREKLAGVLHQYVGRPATESMRREVELMVLELLGPPVKVRVDEGTGTLLVGLE